ncbi:hypothetical protein Emed_004572 [Eimeria media]
MVEMPQQVDAHAAAAAAAAAAAVGALPTGPNQQFGCTYTTSSSVPAAAADAVLQQSAPLPGEAITVRGLDLRSPPSLEQLTTSLLTTGFQATQLGRAIEVVNAMLDWKPPSPAETAAKRQERRQLRDKKRRLRELVKREGLEMDVHSSEECSSSTENEEDSAPQQQQQQQQEEEQRTCSIWLSFTSNMISSGLREYFVFLAKHKMIRAAVTSAGGAEEDLIKCLGPTVVGEFSLKGKWLRRKGWNRIGNLIVPNENYCRFEDWLQPQLDRLLEKQQARLAQLLQQQQKQQQPLQQLNLSEVVLTPSDVLRHLGEAIGAHPRHEESFLYWCYKNEIPVFCPGLTDGSLGDNVYFHTYRNPGLVIDIAADIRKANDLAARSKCSGLLILGGGLPKHHTCNAHLMKNGAEFAVYLNSASEFDGSDSGARPDEAVSWGKIKAEAQHVKVTADATLTFPLLVAATFARRHFQQQQKQQQ